MRFLLSQWKAFLTWLCACCPLALLFLLLALALHIRLGLGHWPRPMVEGYDSFWFGLHDDAVGWMYLFSLHCAGPLWLAMVCVPQLRLSLRRHLFQCGVFFGGWFLIFLAGRLDPTTFTEWLLD
jgi:hypothetical protein